MSDSILSKGDFKDKIIYFPNWAEEIFENPTYREIQELPKGYKIMIAGNLGSAQDLESVMKTALILKETEVRWILIGDGSKRDWIEKFIDENDLKKSVFLLGRFPIDLMPSFYINADSLLLSLRNKFPHLTMIVPAKLQTYMSSGKPILAMIDGGAAELIKESDCGLSVKAGDYEGFANLIKYYVLKNKEEFAQKGNNGKKYFDKNFRLDVCMENLISIIEDERK
jgi:glycosyltransferase involved in cell wall biosynthesis